MGKASGEGLAHANQVTAKGAHKDPERGHEQRRQETGKKARHSEEMPMNQGVGKLHEGDSTQKANAKKHARMGGRMPKGKEKNPSTFVPGVDDDPNEPNESPAEEQGESPEDEQAEESEEGY